MSGGTPAHFAHAFTSTDMCPIEVSNGRCLGYDVSVMHIFVSVGNHLHVGINPKNDVFKICCPLEQSHALKMWR